MVQIVYNIYFEIDEYHPIKGQLLFILLVYVGLLLGTRPPNNNPRRQGQYIHLRPKLWKLLGSCGEK